MKDVSGALVMVAVGVVPAVLAATVTLILAITIGHPWNWISGAFWFVTLFLAFAATVIYREDNPT